ncbi:MAG: DUF3504 domain-containing protein, partial [Bacteroidetes bacterium]|nr:DUF3504 domain-containing protein [Bacteroidota bacterium]
MNSANFSSSNRMLFAVIKDMKKDGLDKSQHYPAISEMDLAKIKLPTSFDLNDPAQLQEKVFFDIQYNFGRRGRENLRDLKRDAFLLGVDDSGREYIELSYNEKTKNHQHASDRNATKPRMYEHQLQSCPVTSLKRYLSKLEPQCDVLFTFPKVGKGFKPEESNTWYSKRPIGKNTLGKFMHRISQRLQLSQMYTNHSIRATTITQLSNAGFEARSIMRVTGHRCESSLRSYSHDNSDQQKRQISDTLMRPPVQEMDEDEHDTDIDLGLSAAGPSDRGSASTSSADA